MIDTRTKICLWVVIVGMINFLAYAIGYTIVGGESIHGEIQQLISTGQQKYFLSPGLREVSKGAFIYIGIHSISIWFTVGAIILAMLTLARDRISDSLQAAAMRGKTLCSVLAIVTIVTTTGLTVEFLCIFSDQFKYPKMVKEYQLESDKPISKQENKTSVNPKKADPENRNRKISTVMLPQGHYSKIDANVDLNKSARLKIAKKLTF